ncbi:hypothetical protein [Streptomyces sp. DK15]|nr:hypothetical protein [Streptomyces sp. DK15]
MAQRASARADAAATRLVEHVGLAARRTRQAVGRGTLVTGYEVE